MNQENEGYSRNDAQCPRPSVVESWPGLWYSFGRVQLTKLPQKTKIRQASWNVGTLTGCSVDPAETLKRRKAQRAYIQGTKQKREKERKKQAKNTKCCGGSNSRHGVGVALESKIKEREADSKQNQLKDGQAGF